MLIAVVLLEGGMTGTPLPDVNNVPVLHLLQPRLNFKNCFVLS